MFPDNLLIAVSLLSIFSFISGQYLPYVIIAVSGSGPIAAVPLAIFAVSTAVALISKIYLIRLAVSRADNKKEEPQKFVCKNCTNLENKSNVPTPQSPPVTFGTQPNPSANMLQPPPPPLSSCASPPPPPQNSSTQQGSNDLLNSIKKAGGKAGMSKEQKKARDEKLKQNREKREKNSEGEQTDSKNALLAEIRGGFKLKSVNKNQQSPEKSTPKTECDIAVILARRVAMECSDSESESSSRESGWSDEGEQEEVGPKQKMLTKHRKKSMPSNPQSFHKERSKSPDSGHVSGDDAKPEPTSPSHPAPEAGKPPIPPKPAGLQTKPEAPPVKEESPVSSEMKDPSTLSVKDHITKFGGEALRCQKENVVQRL
ncbi:WH2 domain-containing protein [Wolbachia endosymbiont (group A) of Cydia strobilella]|uniref:WH2 domain-containing protein n=1 Tax=Wolbachia endosymbiont (group A) of Cydia strobilella TaxID=3066170 RepID=UPI0031333C4A